MRCWRGSIRARLSTHARRLAEAARGRDQALGDDPQRARRRGFQRATCEKFRASRQRGAAGISGDAGGRAFRKGETRFREKFPELVAAGHCGAAAGNGELLVSTLELSRTVFRSDHASNWLALKGTLGADKARLLQQLRAAIAEPEARPVASCLGARPAKFVYRASPERRMRVAPTAAAMLKLLQVVPADAISHPVPGAGRAGEMARKNDAQEQRARQRARTKLAS